MKYQVVKHHNRQYYQIRYKYRFLPFWITLQTYYDPKSEDWRCARFYSVNEAIAVIEIFTIRKEQKLVVEYGATI